MQPVIVNGSTVPLLGQGDAALPLHARAAGPGLRAAAGHAREPARPRRCWRRASAFRSRPAAPACRCRTASSTRRAAARRRRCSIRTRSPCSSSARAQYNSIIAAIAGAAPSLVDANARFNEIAAHGYSIGGITLTTAFLTGGIFSYDGVHPSTIGYTIVAERVHQGDQRADRPDFPQPNFSSTLFTPNPPNPGRAPARPVRRAPGATPSTCGETCSRRPSADAVGRRSVCRASRRAARGARACQRRPGRPGGSAARARLRPVLVRSRSREPRGEPGAFPLPPVLLDFAVFFGGQTP